MIKDIKQLDFDKRYTYADYLTWQFDEMVELIKGKVYRMSPAPNRFHQQVSANLHGLIWSYLRKNPCQVFAAPFDVRLPLPHGQKKNEKIDTVVQPDICVVCDTSKLDHQGCNGAPDWVIEILSKATSKKDLNEKFELYQNAGVQEYWIVHPHEATILIYQLDKKGKYKALQQKPFVKGNQIPVGIFADLSLDADEIFPED